MARIRTIKPGFFTDEYIAELKPIERLFYIGLFTQADRLGRLEDRPRRLKAELLPYDEADTEEILNTLADHPEEFIKRYSVDGLHFISIRTFEKHQRPSRLEPPSLIPAFDGSINTDPGYPNKKKRISVYDRDNYICQYCGIDLRNEPRKICLDHINPLAMGGGNHFENLTTACKKCNAQKAAHTPEEVGFKRPLTYRQHTVNGVPTGREGKGRGKEGERNGELEKQPLAQPSKKVAPKESSEDFNTWWEAYPSKVGRLAAVKIWKKQVQGKVELSKMLSILEKQKDSDKWTKEGGQFIPNPATYLNQGRWDDEVSGGGPVTGGADIIGSIPGMDLEKKYGGHK